MEINEAQQRETREQEFDRLAVAFACAHVNRLPGLGRDKRIEEAYVALRAFALSTEPSPGAASDSLIVRDE